MTRISVEVGYDVVPYHDPAVTETDKILIKRAAEARMNAYAPYSNFWVGVALLGECGNYSWGCNAEVATYSQCSHAEQVGICNLITKKGPTKIRQLALVGAPEVSKILVPPQPVNMLSEKEPDKVCWPCGHCRQIIWEYCQSDKRIRIVSLHPRGFVFISTIGDLYPFAFGPDDLGIDLKRYKDKTGRAL